MNPPHRLKTAWIRVVLALYPPGFRRAHADEVREFVEREEERSAERGESALRTRLRLLLDLLRGAVRAHRAEWSLRRGPSARRPFGDLAGAMMQDVRVAARGFARRPGFTVLVLLTLAVGIGATTAMVGVVDAVLFRALPFPDAGRLVSIYPTQPGWRTHETLAPYWDRGRFTYPQLVEFRDQQRSYEKVGGYSVGRATLAGEGAPEQVGVGYATLELFDVLGTQAQLGRLFAPSDDANVILLSDALWRTRFGGSRDVLGRAVDLGGRSRTVVGVLPADFEVIGTPPNAHGRVLDAGVWQPIVSGPADNAFIAAVGRLRAGVSVRQANAEAAQLIPAIAGEAEEERGGRALARQEDQGEPYARGLMVLLAAAALLLGAACVSVATMLFGAGIEREGELAIRSALGGSRARLARQLVSEGLLLGVLGGGAGVALAVPLLRVLIRLAPAGTAGLSRASIDPRVLLFALGATVATALLFTIAPAMTLSRVNLTLRSGTRVAPGGRVQHGLIAVEIALATVLLTGAGLLTRTMLRLNAVDPGFETAGLLTVRIAPDYARFRAAGPPSTFDARMLAYFTRINEALRTIPGVEEATVAGTLPYSVDGGGNEIEAEGYRLQPGEVLTANRRSVGARYFEVMRMRRVAGRWFEEADERPDAAPVVIANETLVRRLWPGESGIGRRVRFHDRDWTIVGVVADARETDLRGDQDLKVYVAGRVVGGGDVSFILRSALLPATLVPLIRERIAQVDPSVAITRVATMEQRMAETLVEHRYRMRLMVAFSCMAALFAVTGVYGVLSRSAARRRRELSIRAALGAHRHDLARLLVIQSLLLAGVGVVAGLVISAFATRGLASMLFDTPRNDPFTLMSIALLMFGLVLLAAAAPARRAASTHPAEVLRG